MNSKEIHINVGGPLRCPIPQDVDDICIHSGINMEQLFNACGTRKASFGHCQDRTYGLIVASLDAMETMTAHTNRLVIQGDNIGAKLDAFVQEKSRWVIDLIGARGYEMITTFEDKDRTALHLHLDQLQNRCERFFNGAVDTFGFGSAWHNMGLALALALDHDMTLLSPDPHNYFIPLTTCSEKKMEKVFAANPPETDFDKWEDSTVNFKSPVIDVAILKKNQTIILPEYEPKGHYWWRSMLTYYAVRPNAEMREIFRTAPLVVLEPCISIHVRHSDKIQEAPLLDFSQYMAEANKFQAKSGISTIYLMTDDDEVIQSTKNYTGFKFHYREQPRTNRGWLEDVRAGMSRKEQEINFLLDIFTAARCEHHIVTYSSNVGRIISEIAFVTTNKEQDVVSLDMEWWMDP
ncbi:glycoprotein 6-alpha-L-fucosyltransferase [Entomortierella parvispora]|uniref:Glycoprotein 6-alpha-L-fucosyltransferase n=1 Tax=Entomortierella parvispora TaxID=205924 RepID=A0A9P3H5W7_9FUNG|nr:glycoprotein 6-alpha-L-fucosyltransferase [Entomortierella parvispora]